MIKVAIVDDHPIVVLGLRKALEHTHDMVISSAGPAPGGAPGRLDADVAVVGIDCEDPLPIVADLVPHANVLVMSTSATRPFVDACLRLGAVRHLDMQLPLTRFADAVRAAAGVAATPEPDNAPSGREHLSRREQEVLTYIADGFTHEQTARRLGVSRHTVDTYVKRVRSKLSVGNKAELTRAALSGFGPAGQAA